MENCSLHSTGRGSLLPSLHSADTHPQAGIFLMPYQFQQAEIKLNCLKASVCLTFKNHMIDNCNSAHLFLKIWAFKKGDESTPESIVHLSLNQCHWKQRSNRKLMLVFARPTSCLLYIRYSGLSGTCGMMDILWRRVCRPISEVRKPSIRILPSGSASRNRAEIRELLPAPVRPTMPTYTRRRENIWFRHVYSFSPGLIFLFNLAARIIKLSCRVELEFTVHRFNYIYIVFVL